jgi:hypothetical protein
VFRHLLLKSLPLSPSRARVLQTKPGSFLRRSLESKGKITYFSYFSHSHSTGDPVRAPPAAFRGLSVRSSGWGAAFNLSVHCLGQYRIGIDRLVEIGGYAGRYALEAVEVPFSLADSLMDDFARRSQAKSRYV